VPTETLVNTLGGVAGRLGSVVPTSLVPDAITGEPERLLRASKVLAETGIVRVERPDKALQAAKALLDLKLTPAAGFVISAIRYPDDTAIVDERGRLTFAEVHRRTNALANSLSDAGVGEGESVAIMCRDHRWFIETVVALSKLGATALLYNTQFAGPQLSEVTKREKPVGIVYDEEFAEVVGEASGRRKRWIAWYDEDEPDGTTLESMIEEGDDSDPVAPSSVGKITLLTSGSTGTPKGASRGQPDAIDPIVAVLSRMPLRAREPTVFAAPLFHAWGFLQFNLGLLLSSTYVLRRRFDPEATLAAIDDNDATALVAVPIMLQRILELDEETRIQYNLSSLRVVGLSGGALTAEVSERWMNTFGDNLYNLYGSTEVAWAAIATPEDLREAPGTSGPPPPGTTLKILDESQKELDADEVGEIYVGNKMLFEGYTGGGSEDMVDGHMATGDLGYLDDEGRLFVQGRADDMIVSGGENVYPEEVEQTLEQHKQVSEAAVIGVEDDEFGQRLKAFVVASGKPSENELKSHVKENLAKFKVPREIVFLDELPRKPQGKVDKDQLEDDDDEDEDSGGGKGSGGKGGSRGKGSSDGSG
jgi:acyl-CoA synthetase (AMP-forming)/AMP-acid ligase II